MCPDDGSQRWGRELMVDCLIVQRNLNARVLAFKKLNFNIFRLFFYFTAFTFLKRQFR